MRRVQALVEQHGREHDRSPTIDELLAYTERRTRAALAALPRGVVEAEGSVDTDGFTDEPVQLRGPVSIDDDGVLFDLTGCDPQRRAPVNSTYAQTFSACAYVLKCLIDPDIPVNDGFYRSSASSRRRARSSTHPAGAGGRRLGDARRGWSRRCRRARCRRFPDRLPAGTKGMICHAGFGGRNLERRRAVVLLETFAGGYGGRSASDGPDAVQAHGQNTENAPVEETEINYPVRIPRYELIEDSEGAGPLPRRARAAPRLPFEHDDVHDPRRPRPWGPHGLFGGQARARWPSTS